MAAQPQHDLQVVSTPGMWGRGEASSLLSQAVTLDSPGGRRHVVSREHAREPSPQRCPLEPAILTLLKDTVHLALAQLQLVILLGLVGIERQVPAGRSRAKDKRWLARWA